MMTLAILTGCQSDQPFADVPKEGFVTVEGGKIWYRIAGKESSGIPLLIVHGGPGATHDYLLNLETLSNERPVIFYDQLGCGNADHPLTPRSGMLSDSSANFIALWNFCN